MIPLFIKSHKILFGLIFIVLGMTSYYGYHKLTAAPAETRYVLAAVEKGTLISSVSGSGQVAVSNQVELKPRASGDIIYLNVKQGQKVNTGALIAQINAKDALKSVRDAEAGLASAELSMTKLKQPTDALTIMQAENTLESAKESKSSAETELLKDYEDGFTTVSDAFLELPTIVSGLDTVLNGNAFSSTQANLNYYSDAIYGYDTAILSYKNDAADAFALADKAYEKNFSDYKTTNRSSDTATVEALIDETYTTSKVISEAIKSANNFIQFYKDKLIERKLSPAGTADTHLSTLNGYTGKINSHLSALLSAKNAIINDRQTIINSTRTIDEKTQSLAEMKAGADDLDIEAQQLSIKQKQKALQDAKEKLADYSVRAPFTGIIASVDVAKGDTVSSGTTIATIITEQKIAEISLNEVDAAKVKVGQKATLTFDALDELTLTGEVIYIDALGAISQGVVSYTVKINFDTQDDRIKPNMSVSTAIITETKTDVLLVPNAAVKFANDSYYVEMPGETISEKGVANVVLTAPIEQHSVEIGSANDSLTEIISGLSAGEIVISRVITAGGSAAKQTNSQGNNFRMPGF